ncbi:hypothetical protein JX265_011616 [Neoarthrinium moseri]|uniref:Very long-chain fatty acid transport protein n=1 Tax=Neoarthrinium moseri TaxID=1658444 RepID=A0A9P9WBW3_9PEZI|nr:hypothetical protein JX265_011616 [Neoarthrinium moseri]
MPVPLAVALPAAAAGLAYLNVKSAFWYDYTLLRGIARAAWNQDRREKGDRHNTFYRLENRAADKSYANRVFLLFEDRAWTYAQCYDMVLRYGNWLKSKYHLKKGDVVAMDMQNSDHYVFVCFGLWSIGAKPAFINYNLTGQALTHCVQAAGAVLMLVDAELGGNIDESVRTTLKGLPIDVLTTELQVEVLATIPERPPDSLRQGDLAHDMAILIYTSGTTGLPKAAIIPWARLTLAGNFLTGWLNTKTTDVFYTPMPLYHSSASIMGLAHILEAGATFAIGKKFSTRMFWKDVRRFDATIIQYVGETLRYLLTAPPEIDPATGENLDTKHRVHSAFGNGLRPDVWEKFRERFGIEKISEFYGATEGFLATWNTTRNSYAAGAIGRNGWIYGLMMKQKMAIIDVDQDSHVVRRDPKTGLGREVPRGEPGELMYVITDTSDPRTQFQGYYNNQEATNSKMVRDVLKKGDAYFRSGDLVSWDKEGRMYFHDRMGDTFRWKSENVATTEVSQMLGLHPSVQEANVYGVQLPNHDGRAGCVAIVLEGEPNAAVMSSLAKHARETLPKYAVPIFLRVVKDVGTSITGTNKQQKHDLRVQGVDPGKVGSDEMWWLKGDTYVKFSQKDWQELNGGRVKL